MRRGLMVTLVSLAGLWFWITPLSRAYAEEPFFGTERATAILNAPGVAVEVGKKAVNIIEPQPEALYNVLDGTWQYGTSFALYGLKSKGYYLASARLGYATDQTVYVGLKADVEALTQRYMPDIPVAGEAVKWLGKYAALGIYGGRNWDDNEWGLGVTAGGTVRF